MSSPAQPAALPVVTIRPGTEQPYMLVNEPFVALDDCTYLFFDLNEYIPPRVNTSVLGWCQAEAIITRPIHATQTRHAVRYRKESQ